MHPLPRSFFQRPTLDVSRELLGKILKIGPCSGRIKEVEAYIGQDDPACHAAVGRTKRNEVMFGTAGHLYVYFTYGMYHCVNIVTEDPNYPAAILIRSIEPLKGQELMIKRRGKTEHLADGPGKLCIALGITTQTHNGLDLCQSGEVGIFDDDLKAQNIQSSSRIGIKVGLEKKWRFFY